VLFEGSSKGRGNRAAAWFADYVAEQGNETDTIQSLALTKGIRGWVEAGPPFINRVSEFDADVWKT
jgi:arsenical-resistance protein 2